MAQVLKRRRELDVVLQFWPGLDQEAYAAAKVIEMQVVMDQDNVLYSF
jgi:hypothetical protein